MGVRQFRKWGAGRIFFVKWNRQNSSNTCKVYLLSVPEPVGVEHWPTLHDSSAILRKIKNTKFYLSCRGDHSTEDLLWKSSFASRVTCGRVYLPEGLLVEESICFARRVHVEEFIARGKSVRYDTAQSKMSIFTRKLTCGGVHFPRGFLLKSSFDRS